MPGKMPKLNKRTLEVTPPDLSAMGLERFAPYLLNRVINRWNLDVSQALKRFNLTTTHMRSLAALSTREACTVGELAALTVTKQPTLSRALDRLVEQGLVCRAQRDGDGRVFDVSITGEGKKVFEEIWPDLYGQYRRLFEGVEKEEYDNFVETLNKLLNNIRQSPF